MAVKVITFAAVSAIGTQARQGAVTNLSECCNRASVRKLLGLLFPSRRIYQQTFIDTYTKVAFAKLYNGLEPRPPIPSRSATRHQA
jgi:hypothetical protein